MMYNGEKEWSAIFELRKKETLLASKARIYSRLLTDMTLAEDMEAIAMRHEERAKSWKELVKEEEK